MATETMETGLVRSPQADLSIPSDDFLARAESFCGRMLDSGYFDAKFPLSKGRQKAVSAMVTVLLYGRDLGMSPMASLTDIYVVNGNPALYTRRKIGLVHRNAPGVVHILQLESDDTHAKYRIERWDRTPHGFVEVSFSLEDAKRQNLMGNPGWKGNPRHQCCWRAISWGLDELCPDLMGENHVYTFEELGVVFNDEGKPLLDEEGEVVTEGGILPAEDNVIDAEFFEDDVREANADGPATTDELSSWRKCIRTFCVDAGYKSKDVNDWMNQRIETMGVKTSSDLTSLQLNVLFDALTSEYQPTPDPT